jgi:glycosyltransferase involved in cell wall biosynthesis
MNGVGIVHPRERSTQGPVGAPRVSAIVLSYNQEAYVEEALRSLLNQTVAVQIVVFDDASSDGTAERARKLLDDAGWPNRSRLVVQPSNVGVARNLAAAVAECEGELLMVNDADDVSVPDRVAVLCATFDESGVDMAASAVTPISEDGVPLEGAFFWRVTTDRIVDIESVDDYGRWLVHGAPMAFRRTLWEMGGPLPASVRMCDLALTHRALARNGVALLKTPLVRYRVRKDGLTFWLSQWSVPRSELRKKIAHYADNNTGVVEDLDRIIPLSKTPGAARKLSTIRRHVREKTLMMRASLAVPSPRALALLVKFAFTRDAFTREFAFRCVLMAIDPARHEMWLRMSPREMGRRLVAKIARALRGEARTAGSP